MASAPNAHDIIALALAEDLGVPPSAFAPDAPPWPDLLDRDATSSAVISASADYVGRVVVREAAVVCGLSIAESVWSTLARACAVPGTPAAIAQTTLEVFPLVAEGTRVTAGTPVAEISGSARVALAGERTALDFLMTLSGIATEAARWQEAAGPGLAVCDTRKTWPGLRALSKYAVRVGGATGHRSGLWDMVLVKDNHLRAAGGIAHAVQAARSARPDLAIEVEADSVEAAVEAVEAGADMVLLDNMDDATLALAVAAVGEVTQRLNRRCLTEASGNITYERLESLRMAGVDRVSSSAITLAPPVDFGLDEV